MAGGGKGDNENELAQVMHKIKSSEKGRFEWNKKRARKDGLKNS